MLDEETKHFVDAAALAASPPYVEAVAFTEDAALHCAGIRADLKKRGALIGANDLSVPLFPTAFLHAQAAVDFALA